MSGIGLLNTRPAASPQGVEEYRRRTDVWLERFDPGKPLCETDILILGGTPEPVLSNLVCWLNVGYYPATLAAEVLRARGIHWKQAEGVPDDCLCPLYDDVWGTE